MTKRMVTLPSREVPVLAEADIVVVGGGSAGVAAAVAASRLGVSCLLIEKSSCAGGTLTNGLLPSIISMEDGVKVLSSGLCKTLVDRASRLMNVVPDYSWFNVHPETVKLVLDGMLEESGVEFLYNTTCTEVLMEEDVIRGIAVSTPEGTSVILGRCFIDATGDGNLSALAGVPCEIGDAGGNVMAPTLCTMWAGVDYSQCSRESGIGREQWHRDQEQGDIPLPEHHFVGCFKNGPTTGIGNLGHAYGCRPLEAQSYTRACVEGRKQAQVFLEYFRERVPGFANAEMVQTGNMLGVRETRRVLADYRLCRRDYEERRHFHDDIGCFAYPIDIHASTTDLSEQAEVEKNVTLTQYRPGENYGIPYRCMLAKGVQNLLLAGRCISADRAMQSSIRVVPGCMLLGEAAGTAAAICTRQNISIREIDIPELRNKLISQGIYLQGE